MTEQTQPRLPRIAADGNVIIIGGGHNGLACAAYLARAGRHVQVLEAAAQLGGAAITREFSPGFRVSAGAHLLTQFDQGVMADLKLRRHGLRMAAKDLPTLALAAHGEHLRLDRGGARGGGLSNADRDAYVRHQREMSRFAALLTSLYRRSPPRLNSGAAGDALALARFGLRMRLMGRRRMREFLRIAGINIYDLLSERFDHSLLKGALALDAVLGNHLGPRSNNSVFNALHRMTGGRVSLPQGGMGAVTQALAEAAREAGACLRTDCAVASIDLDGDRVTGVTLASGEVLPAATVVSNADPKTTFLDLLGARNLEAGFAARVDRIRARGVTAKLHLALDGPPGFTEVDDRDLAGRLVIAPDPDYVERAFNHAKYGEFSEYPAMEISVPTARDDSLAPKGKHVLSAVVQYAPHDLKGGWDETRKSAFETRILEVLEAYAPGLRDRVVASELLTPFDLAREFRNRGGHWHHGELTLDQALMLRPVPTAAQYATPVDGLYLCGAGSHPGGGVMGSAGRNAARAVLEGRS